MIPRRCVCTAAFLCVLTIDISAAGLDRAVLQLVSLCILPWYILLGVVLRVVLAYYVLAVV